MRIPIGPLLNFEDGLTPRIGSAFSARCSSISPMDFMLYSHLLSDLSISKKHSICNYFPVSVAPHVFAREHNGREDGAYIIEAFP